MSIKQRRSSELRGNEWAGECNGPLPPLESAMGHYPPIQNYQQLFKNSEHNKEFQPYFQLTKFYLVFKMIKKISGSQRFCQDSTIMFLRFLFNTFEIEDCFGPTNKSFSIWFISGPPPFHFSKFWISQMLRYARLYGLEWFSFSCIFKILLHRKGV